MGIEMWKDDRTEKQMKSHTIIVAARDKSKIFNDVCGRLGGSTAAWACKLEDADAVFNYVHSRNEMTHVRFTTVENLERVKGVVHIYVGDRMRNRDWV